MRVGELKFHGVAFFESVYRQAPEDGSYLPRDAEFHRICDKSVRPLDMKRRKLIWAIRECLFFDATNTEKTIDGKRERRALATRCNHVKDGLKLGRFSGPFNEAMQRELAILEEKLAILEEFRLPAWKHGRTHRFFLRMGAVYQGDGFTAHGRSRNEHTKEWLTLEETELKRLGLDGIDPDALGENSRFNQWCHPFYPTPDMLPSMTQKEFAAASHSAFRKPGKLDDNEVLSFIRKEIPYTD